MSDIRQGDIHPRQEPIEASEDPLMRWLRYGMGDLFYAIAKERGLGSLHVFQFLVNEAVHEASQRVEQEAKDRPPNSFRLDTSELRPPDGEAGAM